jgi:nitrogen fixation NifU-like protein
MLARARQRNLLWTGRTLQQAAVRGMSATNVGGHTEPDPYRDLSPTVLDHALRPRNSGALSNFTGHARITGPCGDTLEFWLLIRDGRVEEVRFTTDGCGWSRACGSMATCLAEGKSIADAAAIGQQDILRALGGLPPEVEHCALLAANTLKAACDDSLQEKVHRLDEASLNA